MTDFLQQLKDQSVRENPDDPLQVEYRELKLERARIDRRLREISEEITHGLCRECGAAFTRRRVTKMFCSQRCVIRSSLKTRSRGGIDIALIERHMPSIEAAGLLSVRQLAILKDVLSNTEGGERNGARIVVAEKLGVSHQRISQVLQRAMKGAKFIEVVLSAQRNSAQPAGEAK